MRALGWAHSASLGIYSPPPLSPPVLPTAQLGTIQHTQGASTKSFVACTWVRARRSDSLSVSTENGTIAVHCQSLARRVASCAARPSGVWGHSDKHAPGHYPEAQCAFKILMIHEVLQFALRIAFRCVLHRCGSLDIRC